MSLIYVPIVLINSQNLSFEQQKQLKILQANTVSAKLWELSSPIETRQPGALTTRYCEYVEKDGEVYLELPETDTIPLDVNANSNVIAEILQPFLEFGVVKLEEITGIYTTLATLKQQAISTGVSPQVNIYDFLPSFWKLLAKTREELEEAGWFR